MLGDLPHIQPHIVLERGGPEAGARLGVRIEPKQRVDEPESADQEGVLGGQFGGMATDIAPCCVCRRSTTLAES